MKPSLLKQPTKITRPSEAESRLLRAVSAVAAVASQEKPQNAGIKRKADEAAPDPGSGRSKLAGRAPVKNLPSATRDVQRRLSAIKATRKIALNMAPTRAVSPKGQSGSALQRPNQNGSVRGASAVAAKAGGGRIPLGQVNHNDENACDELGLPGAPALKKRAAWDTKGRLEDMEVLASFLKSYVKNSNAKVDGMSEKLSHSEQKIDDLERFRLALENKVEVKEKENHEKSRQMEELQHQARLKERRFEEEMDALERKHKRQLEDMKGDYQKLQRELDNASASLDRTRDELSLSQQEARHLRGTISQQSTNQLALESDCSALKRQLEIAQTTLRLRETAIAELQAALAQSKARISELDNKVREEESIRRRMHNTIQELKGNIRVFCRVRPALPEELGEQSAEQVAAHLSFPLGEDGQREICLSQRQESVAGNKSTLKSFPFKFDQIFDAASSQQAVFEEISQLVQSALDGYPVCIFAYGQTGSGKTFTMEGPPRPTGETEGMIPRAVQQIYAAAEALANKGWRYAIEGQFLEIYNETIHDLLGAGDASKKHEIKHLADGKTAVSELTTMPLDSPGRVHALLKRALQNRAVAATQCNERSSRSHSVFTLRLSGRNSITEETSEGVLNLIDLAGSERLSVSGSVGDRLKETQAINKSLSCLGDVITAIANGEKHVPYRNSKLTYLLQNSLGGNSKTLMFVNVSPLAANFQETLCSLRFATKVNSCHIGTARKLKSDERAKP